MQDFIIFILSDPNREYKPKVKQWLYRKIYLDEFKSFDYAECKRKIGDLRRSIESVMMQKKKKAPKPKPPAPSPQHQVSSPPERWLTQATTQREREFSLSSHYANGVQFISSD